jgi:hypothetical protein
VAAQRERSRSAHPTRRVARTGAVPGAGGPRPGRPAPLPQPVPPTGAVPRAGVPR